MFRKWSYFKVQPLQRETHSVSHCCFLKCLCVSVCAWLTGQPAGSCRCKEGFGGLRCDRWETHTQPHRHIHTHKETETHCDRWAEPFSCCLFQLVFGNCQKVSIKIFDMYYHTLGFLDYTMQRSLWINGCAISVRHAFSFAILICCFCFFCLQLWYFYFDNICYIF